MAFQKSSLIGFSHYDISSATVFFFPCAMTGPAANGVYTDVIHDFRGAGAYTLKNLSVYAGTVSRVGTTSLDLYKNGGISSLGVSFDDTGDDQFYTDAGSEALTATDTICMRCSAPGGGGTVELRSCTMELLTTSGPTVYLLQASGDVNVNSGLTAYIAPAGGFTTLAGNDSDVSFKVRAPGRIKFLQATLDATIASGTVTITLMKNGVATTMTCAVGVNQTAIDTTNSVRVATGDTISYRIVSDTLASTPQLETVSVLVESDNNQSDILANGSQNYAAATGTHYGQCFGGNISAFSVSDADTKMKIPFDTRVGRLRLKSGLGTTGTATLTLRANGVDTGLVLTIAAGSAGVWHETPIGMYADVTAGDELDLKLDYSGWTARPTLLGMTLNYEPEAGGAQVWIGGD